MHKLMNTFCVSHLLAHARSTRMRITRLSLLSDVARSPIAAIRPTVVTTPEIFANLTFQRVQC